MMFGKEKEHSKAGPMASISVVIENEVNLKIQHWIRKAPGEVSGLGKVIVEGGVFKVVSAVLVQQENGGASTEMDPASVAKAMYELREQPGSLNFWWHSHANMSVFWSGTDIDTIREIGQHGFVLSTVFNKKGESLTSLYIRAQNGLPEVFLDALPMQVLQFLRPDVLTAWDAEYELKCKPINYSGGSTFNPLTMTDRGSGMYGSDWRRGDDIPDPVQTDLPLDRDEDPTNPHHGKYLNEGYRRAAEDQSGVITRGPRWMTEEEIDELLLEMESERNYAKAKGMLFQACAQISKKDWLPEDVRHTKRQGYIRRFNDSRPAAQPAPDKPPTPLQLPRAEPQQDVTGGVA